jgi:nucleotide-binding universal stress UspA family protein
MLQSLLLALDDTPGALAARDAAIALARRSGAALTAAAILDRPHTSGGHEAMPIGGAAFAAQRDAARAARLQAEAEAAFAAARQAAGDLPVEALLLEEAPEPALLRAGARHDLLILGRDSTLGLERADDGLAPVIPALLRDGARPLLVIPAAAPAEGPVLAGYDGSAPAQRALASLAQLGLAEGSAVTLLAADPHAAVAARLAAEGAAFLRRHGLAVEERAARGHDPAALLLAEAARLPARLLVMGGFGTAGLSALLHESTSRRLLHGAPCPILAVP